MNSSSHAYIHVLLQLEENTHCLVDNNDFGKITCQKPISKPIYKAHFYYFQNDISNHLGCLRPMDEL